jgi:pilus assembly protein CpaE
MNDRTKGTISVLVLDNSGRYGEPAAAALGAEPNFQLVTSRLGHGEGVQAAKSQRPDVILLGGKVPELTSVIEELDDAVPDSAVVVILQPGEEELARQCTLAGARGYLFKFPQKEELIGSIRELTRRQARRRAQLAAAIMPGVRIDQGRLIAGHGAKGGVGTTTVAVNLAVAMRRQSHRAISLVDASLHGGDVGVALNLRSPQQHRRPGAPPQESGRRVDPGNHGQAPLGGADPARAAPARAGGIRHRRRDSSHPYCCT